VIVSGEGLRQLIPHAGTMCLLEQVVHCDKTTIRCTSRTHLDPDNPLRSRNRLHAVCGIEYAAQAMALHGALMTRGNAGSGYLASVRDVHWHATQLDNVRDELQIEATCLTADANAAIYRFRVYAGDTELLHGRASVFLRGVRQQ
jgi:predicted hotdog family 3-hydroxylacyl-ACP dehydratase